MFVRLLLVFVLLPLADLVLIWMLLSVNVGLTVLWILVSGIVGAWYVRRQGIQVLNEIRSSVDENKVPTDMLVEGGIVLFAGGLLITPGLLTDILGFSMLIKPCRRWYRKRFLGWLKSKVTVKTWSVTGNPPSMDSGVIDAEVVSRTSSSGPDDNAIDPLPSVTDSSEVSS